MNTATAPKGQLMWVGLVVLVALSGLCTIFTSVITAAQAWQEHTQAQWPEVTARVEKCGLTQTSTRKRDRYYIRCRLSYAVGDEQNAATVFSIRRYLLDQAGPLQEWVDQHPQGTPIVVRYDPAHHAKVVMAATETLFIVLRTPNNVKLLDVWAGSFLVLVTIAGFTRPRPGWQNGYSSMPLKS
jgi:Protein of unknown function (DUF3592)